MAESTIPDERVLDVLRASAVFGRLDVRDGMGVDPSMTRLSVRSHLRWRVNAPPGIGDILYRASHVGDLHQRPRAIALSDHYLEPPDASFPLMGYGRAAQIAEVGYRYAMREIATWKSQASETV